MTVGELRRLFVDLSIPDNTHIHILSSDDKKTNVISWFIEKSPSGNEYELILISSHQDKPKEVKPPPFKNY